MLCCEIQVAVFTAYRSALCTGHMFCSVSDKKGSDAVYSNSSKQFLIMVPPAVLTLHLKRFEQVRKSEGLSTQYDKSAASAAQIFPNQQTRKLIST